MVTDISVTCAVWAAFSFPYMTEITICYHASSLSNIPGLNQ